MPCSMQYLVCAKVVTMVKDFDDDAIAHCIHRKNLCIGYLKLPFTTKANATAVHNRTQSNIVQMRPP